MKLKQSTTGFTLVELMIVVAIIGILAAAAVPAFLGYIREAKKSEGKANLKALADGALSYFQEEHPASDGLRVTTKVYPADSVCTAGGDVAGSKVSPDDTDWSAFEDLSFSIAKPHYYKFCYTVLNNRTEFEATADAALSGNGIDSSFVVTGTRTPDNLPILTAVRETL